MLEGVCHPADAMRMATLATKMAADATLVRTHHAMHGTQFANSFRGSDAVSWLVASKEATTCASAEEMCALMRALGLCHHVCRRHSDAAGYLYRFADECQPPTRPTVLRRSTHRKGLATLSGATSPRWLF